MNKVHDVIDSLQPGMSEYSDNSKFHYWMDYACTLDQLHVEFMKGNMVEFLNSKMKSTQSSTPVHHACTDVASTLSSFTEYEGVFVYG